MDDIIKRTHIVQPAVIQTAEKSVYIESKENATINLTINMPHGTQIGMLSSTGSANDTPTIQGLSHEYYNLIVFDDPDIELPANVAWVSVSRSPYELLKIPAVICYENTSYHCKTDPNHKAMLAYITDVERNDDILYVSFTPICLFHQQLLNENLGVFGLSVSSNGAICELNTSHWAIKERNIFRSLKGVGVVVPQI